LTQKRPGSKLYVAMPESQPKPPVAKPRIDPLWIMLLMLVLLGVMAYVATRLSAASKLQDCMMQGRRNCADGDDGPMTK